MPNPVSGTPTRRGRANPKQSTEPRLPRRVRRSCRACDPKKPCSSSGEPPSDTLMLVPEAPVDEDRHLPLRQYDIRLSRQILVAQTEAEAQMVEQPAYTELWRRVLAANAGHQCGTLTSADLVHLAHRRGQQQAAKTLKASLYARNGRAIVKLALERFLRSMLPEKSAHPLSL